MSLSLPSRGRHTSAHQSLRADLRQAETDNQALTAAIEDREREIHTALVRGCQDAMLIAHLREQLAGAVVGIRQTQHSLVRSKAEQERLRQAVVNARPRIHQVDTDLVRPFSPVVCLPYVSPVPYRDTSNDATQQLPVVDRPG
ncbi:hypothetical protein [Streptomyces sp. WAC 01325]|uniref:hypothetical protein n=1 Tax=Streptomyces sp. WAC 01325 TaxID=2203202 RepID=UPI00163B858A|nr:hypothetical protein [Streptomyces sp. WAC 01325]